MHADGFLVVLSAAILIAAAVATVWYERKAPTPPTTRNPESAGSRPSPRPALILVAPPALGSYSAVRTGTALQQPYGYAELPQADPLPLQVTGFVALSPSGTYTPRTTKDPVNGAPIPYLKVTEATPAKAPKDRTTRPGTTSDPRQVCARPVRWHARAPTRARP